MCNGKRKTAGGFIWEYDENFETIEIPIIYGAKVLNLTDYAKEEHIKEIKSQFTFAYKASHIYNMTPAVDEYKPPRYINENHVLYDIKERNKKILRDDDDFDF